MEIKRVPSLLSKAEALLRVYPDLAASAEDLEAASRFLAEWERLKNIFHWKAPDGACMRRSIERYNSGKLRPVTIAGDVFEGAIKVTCIYSHVEVDKALYVNGKPARITALKKHISLKKLLKDIPDRKLPLLLGTPLEYIAKERLAAGEFEAV